MNPLGNRARAEELARLLEGSLDGGLTPSSAGLAALAGRLRAVSPVLDDAVPLRPEFRAALRQRLVAVASVQGAQATAALGAAPDAVGLLDRVSAWSRTWNERRRLALASGAMAGVVAVTGVAVASSRSLPGQPFYGLKRASEGVQLQLASGDTAKGTKHLEFAATRLREVRALAHGDSELALGTTGTLAAGRAAGSRQQRITETLADFDSETTKGRTLLEGVYRSTGRTAPLRVLTQFSAQQRARLSTLIPELPAQAQVAAQESLALVTEVGTTASELLDIGTCTASCDPSTGGPTLPVEPGPTPDVGPSGTPDGEDDNGVPPCTCVEPSTTPEPTPGPEASPSDEPTPEPTSSPTPSRTPTPTPSSTTTPAPGPWPTVLPTVLPTSLPTILPTLGPPASLLPTLAPEPAVEP